jgi:hypothetical protein
VKEALTHVAMLTGWRRRGRAWPGTHLGGKGRLPPKGGDYGGVHLVGLRWAPFTALTTFTLHHFSPLLSTVGREARATRRQHHSGTLLGGDNRNNSSSRSMPPSPALLRYYDLLDVCMYYDSGNSNGPIHRPTADCRINHTFLFIAYRYSRR